ncbi:glycine zipper 2TM domain-containing protein [Novosphingobium sp. KA1]|uniref:glycine zipper 2TM domain-containing protein n=1 Tax=Novosphingobium sp. (strain KA1) TaxID=164608 RepID=UPI001A8D917F|nr:glycine zipper 2TM domain-containing protein [Novosphingobium sp. KA1]QSR19669.1 hypothetical protein CA833_21210 [Novosphingobium sp. KA1]
MKIKATSLALLVCVVSSLAVPAEAQQRRDRDRDRDRYEHQWRENDRNWEPSRSYRSGKYKDRRLGRNDRIYRGRDGRAYCRRSDGTTGLVIGGIGGALIGKAVGGGTLGTLIGAGGGALLGRQIDRGEIKCR